MTPWCRQQIPVEGNFGRLFDQLNAFIQQLSSEFSAKVEVQVRHSYVAALKFPLLAAHRTDAPSPTSAPQKQHQQEVLQDETFSAAVGAALRQLQGLLEQLLLFLQLLISCTFVTIFTQLVTFCSAAAPPTSFSSLTGSSPLRAFSYLRCYLNDLQFDNIYVTALFQQIDARRKRAVTLPHPSA